ncbi:MAG TPA: hypothetical protein VJ246_02175 [Patescibacteria group bacterium]|nr:hypothetical protein [Patescibacteria group bacterium]
MSIEVVKSIFDLLSPENAAAIAAMFTCGFLAFSAGTWREIMNRDGGKSVKSGLGPPEHRVEAAHINHQRGWSYDKASNGRVLTIQEHYEEHIFHHRDGKRSGRCRNGCSVEGNLHAAVLIWDRMTQSEREGLSPPPVSEEAQVETAFLDSVG